MLSFLFIHVCIKKIDIGHNVQVHWMTASKQATNLACTTEFSAGLACTTEFSAGFIFALCYLVQH
jgi:hypothetical protein